MENLKMDFLNNTNENTNNNNDNTNKEHENNKTTKKMTKREQLYRAIEKNEGCTLWQAIGDKDIERRTAYISLMRMIEQGLIYKEDDKYYTLAPYVPAGKDPMEKQKSDIKADYYKEMLDAYLEDFLSASNFDNKVKIGREMRLLIKNL